GMKKLNNFMSRLADYEAWKKLANPEDIEYNECQLEMSQQLITSHTIPDRIIAQRTGDEGGLEYYIKWKNLPYVEATWESGDLIDGEFESVIENFKFRQESRYAPSSKSKYLKYRPKFSSIKAQPDYMGGSDDSLKLRDYQLDGINWLAHAWCKQNSVILADEMGLGKTIQTVNFLYYLFHTHQLYGPFLVVVPLSTLDAWQKEFARWAPDINVLSYVGDAASRGIYEWTHPGNKRSKFNAILTTYEIVLKDKQYLNNVPYAVIMVDEAHRLKNDDSMLYKCLKDLTVYQRLLITGTPLQNSSRSSGPSFTSSCRKSLMNGRSSTTKAWLHQLHKLLEPYILRRVKKDVEKSLPAKVERILRVDMSRKQKQYYKWILTRNYAALTKGVKGSTLSFVNIVMELKKCCNHVLLTRPEEMDSALSMTSPTRQAPRPPQGNRTPRFSSSHKWFYLELRRFSFQRLDGGIKGELRKQALEHFNVPGSTDFCFLLSTRAGGLGINLATADTVIIFDSDWNPQNDLQAQARAHRIGQKDQVNVYRLVTMNSVEEDIIERAKKKNDPGPPCHPAYGHHGDNHTQQVLGEEFHAFSKEELSAILKFGAEDLFKDEDETGGDEEPKCDIDEILNRAETREEEIASFAVDEDEPITIEKSSSKPEKDWSDIIPQDILERVEEEERQKEIQELCLGPRNRKTVGDESSSKRKRSSEDEEDSDSESGKPSKKRGRPSGREKVTAGFTDTEVRRFVKSFKKFPKPISRLEAVATDAELQEKALGDLVKLGNALYERCNEAVHEAEPLKSKAVSIKLGNVAVNAKTLCESVHLLDPLASFLPLLPNEDDRSPWSKVKSLPFKYKDPGYDEIDWGMSDDVSLLKGVYIHGLGSWDSIKMDRDLDLRDKIMPNADRKPQAKHLDTRSQETGGGSGDKPLRRAEAHGPKNLASALKGESEGGKYKSVDIIVENTDSSNNEEDEKSEKKETKKENIDDRNRDKKAQEQKEG
ncbi:ChromodomainhelicaseDNAbinding protein 1like, partial [Caligus rogercresseyi]